MASVTSRLLSLFRPTLPCATSTLLLAGVLIVGCGESNESDGAAPTANSDPAQLAEVPDSIGPGPFALQGDSAWTLLEGFDPPGEPNSDLGYPLMTWFADYEYDVADDGSSPIVAPSVVMAGSALAPDAAVQDLEALGVEFVGGVGTLDVGDQGQVWAVSGLGSGAVVFMSNELDLAELSAWVASVESVDEAQWQSAAAAASGP